ncbi:MAG: IS1595 family transposase [Acidobacteriota bacterium]
MADILSEPRFNDPDAARNFLEAQRWPTGKADCPHCGECEIGYRLTPKPGSSTRKGVWKCGACRKQFTVTVNTIFSDSHIALNVWLKAIHFLCASKKGMSAHQLHRMLGITYKSAWFMAHRIRYSMTQEPLSSKLDGIVEVDETYVGGKRRDPGFTRKPGERPIDRPGPFEGKAPVVSVLQRGGRVQSLHVERVTSTTLKPIIKQMVDDAAHLMTDTSTVLRNMKRDGTAKHSLVNHRRGEYSRIEEGVVISTNTVEGYFSILKRGINGVYHHVGKQHLHRYLAEFDFRYNSRSEPDAVRAAMALGQTKGKRLMYRDSCGKKKA